MEYKLGYSEVIDMGVYKNTAIKKGGILVKRLFRLIIVLGAIFMTFAALSAAYIIYGFGGHLASFISMLCVLTAAALSDIKTKTIPDGIIIIGVLAALVCAHIDSEQSVLGCLAGGLAAGGIFLLVSIVTRGGVGMGDVKLMGCIGMFTGVGKVLELILFSVLISGFAGIVFFALNIKNRKKTIPFAPFALAGAILTIMI